MSHARTINQWRYGSPPNYTYVWLEDSEPTPDPDAVIVDTISTEFPVSEAGMPCISPIPYTPQRGYRQRGNGHAPYIAIPNATNIFDWRIDESYVGTNGYMEFFGGSYWTDNNVEDGDYIEFAITDKDDVLGYFETYSIPRPKLNGLTAQTGTFTVGEIVTGGTSSATGKVMIVGSDYLVIRADYTGTFVNGEALTGGTSGATATLGTMTAGGAVEISKYIEKRRVVKNEQFVKTAPGGSTPMPPGIYMRLYVVTTNTGVDRKIYVAFDTAQ